jgi:hypothetical protein
MGEVSIARVAKGEQARVDGFERDQDLQPQVIGAGHVRAVPLAVLFSGEELRGVLVHQAQVLAALGILERGDRRFAQHRDVAERDGVLAASGIPGDQVADCGIVLTNFKEVFVHSVLSVVLLLEC